jgi:hypothetical protein
MRVGLLRRVFAVNAGFLALLAVLLPVTPATISAPIVLIAAAIVLVALAVTSVANAILLHRRNGDR